VTVAAPPGPAREVEPPRADEGRRSPLSPGDLLVGSLASAGAALVIHELWAPGALIGAALTPVLIALLTELLRRPVDRVATLRPSRHPAAPGRRTARVIDGTPVRIYRVRPRWRLALAGGLLAFALGAGGLTAFERLADRSLADRDANTTLFDRPASRPTPEPAGPSGAPGPDALERDAPARGRLPGSADPGAPARTTPEPDRSGRPAEPAGEPPSAPQEAPSAAGPSPSSSAPAAGAPSEPPAAPQPQAAPPQPGVAPPPAGTPAPGAAPPPAGAPR